MGYVFPPIFQRMTRTLLRLLNRILATRLGEAVPLVRSPVRWLSCALDTQGSNIDGGEIGSTAYRSVLYDGSSLALFGNADIKSRHDPHAAASVLRSFSQTRWTKR